MRQAVFLDRDGTMLEEAGYLASMDRLVFFPYTLDAVRLLNRAGFAVVVVTNQAGIARGIVKEAFVEEAHAHIAKQAADAGARIDAFYYCPHHPQGIVEALRCTCDCRKPAPGLLRRAAADLDLELTTSYMVGDKVEDVLVGRAAGARSVLVRTGYGYDAESRLAQQGVAPAAVADNLMGAVSWILRAS